MVNCWVTHIGEIKKIKWNKKRFISKYRAKKKIRRRIEWIYQWKWYRIVFTFKFNAANLIKGKSDSNITNCIHFYRDEIILFFCWTVNVNEFSSFVWLLFFLKIFILQLYDTELYIKLRSANFSFQIKKTSVQLHF